MCKTAIGNVLEVLMSHNRHHTKAIQVRWGEQELNSLAWIYIYVTYIVKYLTYNKSRTNTVFSICMLCNIAYAIKYTEES